MDMLTKTVERMTAPREAVRTVHVCALCRGKFTGEGYRRKRQVYCCDVCADRDAQRGWLGTLAIAGALMSLGFLLANRVRL